MMRRAALLIIFLLTLNLSYGQAPTSLQEDTLALTATALSSIPEGEEDESYVEKVMLFAKEQARMGHLKESISWGRRGVSAALRLYGDHHPRYAQALSDLAGCYSRSGNYSEALRLGNEAMQIREKTVGTESLDYAQSLNNVARYQSYLGHYIEAVRLGRKALELRESLLGKESEEYAQSASNLAGYHSRLGDYDDAIRLGETALQIRGKILGENSADYAQSLNNLAKYHYFKNEYAEAIRLEEQALSLRERLLGKHHPDYATALSNLADYYFKTGDFDKAMVYGREAMQIREEVLGKDHPEFAESVSNLASYNYALGHYAEAVDYGREAVNLRRRLLGQQHLSYAHSLCKLAVYYSANEQLDSASVCAYEATNDYTRSILNTFADLTSSEREQFWMRVKPWFSNTLPQLVEQNPSPQMVSSAYNATLLAKGLLLNSELEMVNLLIESGDSALIDNYHHLQTDQALLTLQYTLPKSKRTINTDSLQQAITKQERRLVSRSKAYGNYTKPLRVEWQRILRQLGPKDVAVEFLCYRSKKGEEQYAAFVISRSHPAPVFIPLMNGQQLSSIRPKDIYTTGKVSTLVWKPLEAYLKEARNVYFAPSGELYNIGIESLPHWEEDQTLLMDRWTFYRVSSTREIALARERGKKPFKNVTIYGGVDYDGDQSAASSPASNQKKKGAKYLPGTRKEAEEINSTLSQNDIPSIVHLSTTASEQSFKQLSGNASYVIHIATHGFYWTDSEVRESGMDEKLQFLAMYGNMDDADKAMTRSGLLLSGANQALMGLRGIRKSDDGILTAKEISMLDLRNVDLLVLSACQTGLGKITGDGVFGLQRGFKKAGANAILMSLWKVDDKATRILMTHFYNYLMEGIGKHEALRRAQCDLRNMDVEVEGRNSSRRAISSHAKRARQNKVKKLYADPYYWAAFILLDGVE
ncbi:MAG: CHAT domain-containing protein [Prevotella sp.]|nr:CHAT domain-containing protein [Prevotella sp.]